ncbi:hypothetical protein PMAYCL1PPCAC_11026 [Pristionchus mayeri]|uniref:Uncharacterized protein n=1 Tax=Pristionchus mayeri TaxID=1317129 RepID=A0AAN4ZHD2_9BILA|nr:hypothetical protein PMAYCL1PPCAC_11026 [Pristionchus mayeri]
MHLLLYLKHETMTGIYRKLLGMSRLEAILGRAASGFAASSFLVLSHLLLAILLLMVHLIERELRLRVLKTIAGRPLLQHHLRLEAWLQLDYGLVRLSLQHLVRLVSLARIARVPAVLVENLKVADAGLAHAHARIPRAALDDQPFKLDVYYVELRLLSGRLHASSLAFRVLAYFRSIRQRVSHFCFHEDADLRGATNLVHRKNVRLVVHDAYEFGGRRLDCIPSREELGDDRLD